MDGFGSVGSALRSETITKEAIYDTQSISPTLSSHPITKNLIDRSPSFVSFIPKFSGTLKIRYKNSAAVKKELLVRSGRSRGSGEGEIFKVLSKDYVLSVGVLDDQETHNGVSTSVSYAKLFELLKHLGYDPLFPIRQKSFIDSLEKRLGDTILQSLNKGKPDDGRQIRAKINSIGRQVVSFVQDYISGGSKPPLERKTIYNRIWKSGSDDSDSLYRNGIDEPLSETGSLEDAIGYKVETYIRPERSEFFERLKEQKTRQRERQKEYSKTRPKNKELSALSAKDAMDKIDEFFAKLNDTLLPYREKAKARYDRAFQDEKSQVKATVRQYDMEIRNLINEAKNFIQRQGRNVDEEWKMSVNDLNFNDLIADFGGRLL